MKPLADYITAAGGDHEVAARALHADLTKAAQETENEAGANIRARAIVKALEPLAAALELPLPPVGQRPTQDATAGLADGVAKVLETVSGLREGLTEAQTLLGKAGLDTVALQKADKTAREGLTTSWLNSLESVKTARTETAQELAAYKFAYAAGLKPDAVLLQKGLEKLEAREIKSTGTDGKEVTSTVWGLPGEGDTFKPATEHLKPVLDALRLTPAKPDGTPWVQGQEGRGNSTGKDALDKAIESRQGNSSKAVDPFSHTTTQSPTTI